MGLYVGFSTAVTVAYASVFAARHSAFPLGDWLINYAGGFVRRGLPGQLVLLSSRHLHMPLAAAAGSLQIACVVCTFACLWPLATSAASGKLWQKALLLSPATLAFPWLDPQMALRKEFLLFALLGTLLGMLRRKRAVSDRFLVVTLSLACPALLLSHEALVVYLPYLAAALALGRRSVWRALRVGIVPAALSLVALFAAVLHPGNMTTAMSICRSVGGIESGLCSGPIFYLAMSRSVYAKEVSEMLREPHMISAFAITFSLALVPIGAGLWDVWQRPISAGTRAVLPAAFLVSAVASAPLFVQAQDWSRWIYIHAMCLLFLLFSCVEQREQAGLGKQHLAANQELQNRKRPRMLFASAAALVLYATTWNLPFVHNARPFGYLILLYRHLHHIA